ncbi:homocysteine S-methyltransferase family protein [Pelagibius marinus]|uniref:homocysteine S-methyltransferase family protein n=1 Tax=Pelagibius marinus TaxID=2762760 RepID=UPI0018731508|nr:homocysteine S-methyltransferase family protein [Pelagibius marinus]
MYQAFMENADFVLGPGSMYERLRRGGAAGLDPHIFHASLIYDERSRAVLEGVCREYLDIAQRHGLPMATTSPTWRANAERVARSGCADRAVNRDSLRFMRELRDSYGPGAAPIVIGGTTGPKGDAYLPAAAPGTGEAESFHRPQVEELADSGADFLVAKTLPAFPEALGIARCMAATEVPYVLSFVVRPEGTLLDGTPLDEAIARIDNETPRAPAHYNVNCVHASVFAAAIAATRDRRPEAAARILGLDANTSAKTPEELEGLTELDTEAPEDFGRNVWDLSKTCGTVYLGGCCGSGTAHIEALALRGKADA